MKRRREEGTLNKYINNNQGAASILIILMLVVLMVFGVTILSTTLSNESLSVRKQLLSKEYYSLESDVAIKLAEIDTFLNEVKYESKTKNISIEKLLDEIDYIKKENDKYYLSFTVSNVEENKFINVKLELVENIESNRNYWIISHVESQEEFIYDIDLFEFTF